MTARRPPRKFVLHTVGTTGDVFPFVAVGVELQQRGHDVVLVANPRFESTAREANLEFVGLGSRLQHRRALADPDLWQPRRGLELVMQRLVPDPCDAISVFEKLVEPPRTVLISHPFGLAARLMQEKYDTPCATLVLSTCLLRSNHRVPAMLGFRGLSTMPRLLKSLMWVLADRLLIDPAVSPKLNRARRRLGIPSIRRPFDGWIFSPTLTIGLFPDWFAPPQPDWPDHFYLTGFPLFHSARRSPPRVNRFLAGGEPPVVFTPGSGAPDTTEFFESGIRACERIGRPALLLGGCPDLPEAATPVMHAEFAPFDAVLPRSCALVHHGGIGTTAAALAAGLPQLVRPLGFGHHDHAARLEQLGAGHSLQPDRLTAETLSASLFELLNSPRVAEQCAMFRRRIHHRQPVRRVCRLLERTFAPASPPGPPNQHGTIESSE